MDSQTHEIFDSLRTHNDGFRETIREGLRQAIKWDRKSAITNAKVLQLELESARQQQKRLTNHLLLAKIAPTTYAETARELRDKEVALKLEIDVNDRGRHELVNIAVKAFELSQRLRQKWLVAD